MLKIKNIVVPTDFSNLSFTAFEYARELAEKMDAVIHLIYVLEKNPPFLAFRTIDASEEEIMQTMEEEAKKQLHDTALKLQEDSGIRVEEICRVGIDFEEIVNYAKECENALIVLATHGRTGILHTLLGSVTEKVIRYSKHPVLVVPPMGEDPEN